MSRLKHAEDISDKLHSDKGKGKDVRMHAMWAYGGVEVWLHSYLIWVLGGCGWSASRTGDFTSRQELPVHINLEAD
jgi:hypothetical protein